MTVACVYVEIQNRCGQKKFIMRLPCDQATIGSLERASRDTSEPIPLVDSNGKGNFRIFGHVVRPTDSDEQVLCFISVHAIPLH